MLGEQEASGKEKKSASLVLYALLMGKNKQRA